MNSNSRRTTDDATLNLSPADVHELGIERITRSLACTYIDTAISKLQSSDAGGGVLLEGGVIAQEEKSSALKNPLDSCRIAGKEASRYSRDFDKFSTLAKSGRKIAQLKWSDFEIGQLLGTGAFCHVYEVTLQKGLSVQESGLVKSGSRDVGDVLKKSGIDKGGANEKNKGGPPIKFALKHLDPDCLRGNQDFSDSAIDLVMEAKILSCLQHPNLVRLHAVTGGSISKVFAKGGYFLLLDRLHGSLSQKMKEWAAAEGNSSAHDKVQRQEHRLKCTALGVARGMGYLHSNRVIYRDLKPSNVGFTFDGIPKLFDFGLAREVADDGRKMTRYTGSARYMAPEVAKSEYYCLSADVYSFGILLWEVCSLKKAYDGMTKEQHFELVVGSKLRPPISDVEGSSKLNCLMQSCWSHKPSKRPTFEQISDILCDMLCLAEDCTRSSPATGKFFRLNREKKRRSSCGITKPGGLNISSIFRSSSKSP